MASEIQVRLFASLREQAGWAQRGFSLANGEPPATPASVWRLLELGPLPISVRVAVNQHFARLDQPLQNGDELAFLPPISGG